MQYLPFNRRFLKPTYNVAIKPNINFSFLNEDFAKYIQRNLKHGLKSIILKLGEVKKESNMETINYFIEAIAPPNYNSFFQYSKQKDAITDAKKFEDLQLRLNIINYISKNKK